MKASGFDIIEQLKKPNFWLSAIAVGLTIIQLDLNWKFIGSIDALTLRGLFLTAILYLIWKKQHTLNLRSDLFWLFSTYYAKLINKMPIQ
ncbi:hypothetical protein [Nostoc sp.]